MPQYLTANDRPEAVLEFWFGSADAFGQGGPREMWFRKQPEVDERIRERFFPTWKMAQDGRLGAWEGKPPSTLAMLLVLDQFPRNMFRDSAQAFASDELAFRVAEAALAKGHDQALDPVARWFFYLPFEHREELAAQRRSVELFAALPDEPHHRHSLDYARRHFEIIERFGRFPHRNRLLGRISSAEEEAFLALPGSSF